MGVAKDKVLSEAVSGGGKGGSCPPELILGGANGQKCPPPKVDVFMKNKHRRFALSAKSGWSVFLFTLFSIFLEIFLHNSSRSESATLPDLCYVADPDPGYKLSSKFQ